MKYLEQLFKNMCKETHSKTSEKQNEVLKVCSSNPQEDRKEKTEKRKTKKYDGRLKS